MQALSSFLVLEDASKVSGVNSKEEEVSLSSRKTIYTLYKHLGACTNVLIMYAK